MPQMIKHRLTKPESDFLRIHASLIAENQYALAQFVKFIVTAGQLPKSIAEGPTAIVGYVVSDDFQFLLGALPDPVPESPSSGTPLADGTPPEGPSQPPLPTTGKEGE